MKKIFLYILAACLFFGFVGHLFAGGEQNYFALFMEGKKVGYAVFDRFVGEGRVKTTTTVNMTISRGAVPMTVVMSETCVETDKGEPLSFEAIQQMSFITMKVSGRVEPNGMMIVEKGAVVSREKWPEGALMSEGLRLLEKEKSLKKGTTFKVKVFSASSVQAFDAEVTAGDRQKVDLLGRIVELTEVRTRMTMPMAGVMETVDYFDDNLEVQKSVMPVMGMTMEIVACTKEFAMLAPEVFDVIDKMFMQSPQPIDNVGSAESITYTLVPKTDVNQPGKSAAGDIIKLESIPSTDCQSVTKAEGGKVIVKVKPAAMTKGVKFPYKGSDKKILAALKPGRFVQSDDERIIKLAKQAVGDANNAAEAAKRIETFVAQYIENRTLSVGYASALEVLDSRAGDCTEFAVLTSALCRAAGMPSQVVFGVAYVKEWDTIRDSFGGHAWVQAYIGDKWVGLDSAFKKSGRGGFDAGHIALAVGSGDPEDFFRVVNTFGQFKIDKVEITTRK
jgi:hypothetical protein